MFAPPLGLQKKAIDWRRGVIPSALALSVEGATTRWSVERRMSLLHRASRSPAFTTIVPGSKDTKLSQLFARIKNGTYYWLCRLKLLCMGVLDFEPANTILEKESKSAIIYEKCVTVPFHCDAKRLRMRTHRNVPQRESDPP